jgi:hypothetical protein
MDPARSGRPGDRLREAIQARPFLFSACGGGKAWVNCLASLALTTAIAVVVPTCVSAQGYPGYPYSIMTPERGAIHQRGSTHRRVSAPETAPAVARSHPPSLLGHEKFIAKLHRRGLYAARGSSGSVLPTPLPKTQLIPPEGGGTLTLPPLQQQQGPTQIPGTAQIIPNLPHGTETFQDRASRCTFQAGLYSVPGNLRNQYMGTCTQ